ncbi:MAG: alpha/beta fold hydrolase [Verrucomicrobiota bacterium]
MNFKLTAALMFALQTMGFAHEVKPDISRECVILIHGLGRTSLSMKRLEWSLASAGYQTINLAYPSRKFRVEQLAEDYLQPVLSKNTARHASKVHFVTHSMGGIILRQYLSNHAIENRGSVVMLAPPNQGSELVDELKRNAVGRWILGPSGCELGTAPMDLPRRLGPARFVLGVIAGDRSFNPRFSRILSGANDGKVSVKRAKIDGMKQFLIVHNSHTWMMWRLKTIQQVLFYLQHDQFNLASEPNHG